MHDTKRRGDRLAVHRTARPSRGGDRRLARVVRALRVGASAQTPPL